MTSHSKRLALNSALSAALAAAIFSAQPASADETPAAKLTAATPAAAKETGLTWHGLTLYGTVDIGVAHEDHSAPLSSDYAAGLPFLIQKFNNRPITSLAPNGLSQSRIGLSANEPLTADVSAIFKLETGFLPTSLHLADGPRSLIASNGKPLDQQSESGDSSRAGQPFQSAAYAGVQSRTWGALTYGRQNSLILDNLQKYDPQAQSQAFSTIGYSGVTGGGGDTEDARLDQALKYAGHYGRIRLAYLHQFKGHPALPGGADQGDVGIDLGRLSLDAAFSHVADAVSASSLTAAQNAVAPGTLAGVISDNTAWSLQGRYTIAKPLKAYAGYEHATFANPAHPIAAGVSTIGGYELSSLNNTAYANHRVLQVSWVGLRWSLTKALDLSTAYYRYDQNSYKGNGCANQTASQCAGQLNAGSMVAAYKLTRRFDLYAGLNYSGVQGGLASGYLKTSAFSQMGGVRFNF